MRSVMFFLFTSLLAIKPAKAKVNDTSTNNTFFRNTTLIRETARDSMLTETKKNYTEAKKRGEKQKIADAAWQLGTDASHRGKYDSAKYYYEESAYHYSELNLKHKVLEAYRMLGTNEGLQTHSAQALGWFLKAKGIAKNLGKEKDLAAINYRIGVVYFQVGDTDNAIKYENIALYYALRTNEKKIQVAVYNNLGMIYTQMGKSDQALKALHSAKVLSEETGDHQLMPELNYNTGNCYLQKGQLDSADLYLRYSLEQVIAASYPIGIATVKNTLAELALRQHEFNEAEKYATESLRLSTELKDTQLIHSNTILLAKVYTRLGDNRNASSFFERALTLDNTLRHMEEVKLVDRIDMEVERKKFSEEVNNLQMENALHKRERNKALIGGAVLLLGTSIVVIGILIIQKKNNLLWQQQKELEEANQGKDKMFAIIAHDLRGPLNSIAGSFDLLRGDAMSLKDKEKLQDELQRSTVATLDTLDNLLHWGAEQFKKEKVVPETVCMSDIVEQNINLLANVARQKSIKLKHDVNASYFAHFDKNQLTFIIRNLIANAIKFSYQGQTVVCSAVKQDERLLVTVEDEGVGMSEGLRNMIFGEKRRASTYGTAGEKGVGLGISMVHEFLERNDGTMHVESIKGKGSKFTINIPAC